MAESRRKIITLPSGFGSLSGGLPPSPPGMIFVQGPTGGRGMAPDARSELVFGRNEGAVHVSVGGTDTTVSRQHGVFTHDGSRWTVRNIGRRPIRLPGGHTLFKGHQADVPAGFVPLIIMSPRQEHLLEVRISTPPPPRPGGDPYTAETYNPDVRELDEVERLVLVCLAQQYLGNDPKAQPLPWEQVAAELTELQGVEWNWRRPHRIVGNVRKRLRDTYGVRGIMADDVSQPSSNSISHNLITDLLVTGTLFPEDLGLLTP